MWIRYPNKKRRDYASSDGDVKRLKTGNPRSYWTHCEPYNDYYHRKKNGTYQWASTYYTQEMDAAQRYAELSKQADSTGTVKGVRIQFSKTPISLALMNRRVTTASSTYLPSLSNPKVTADYKISFSPSISTDSGAVLGYISDPQEAEKKRPLHRTYEINNAKISGVSLTRDRVTFAPSVDTQTRELPSSISHALLSPFHPLNTNTPPVAKDTRIITSIKIIVHDASPHIKTLKTTKNHWSIYLILNQGAGCVRVNMTMSEFDRDLLEWTLLSYPLSLSKIREWDWGVVGGVRVGNFWRLVHENGRERYVAGKGGQGSGFWVYAVIADLVKQKWLVNENAGDEMWNHVQHFYFLGGATKRVGIVPGFFY